MSSSAAGAIAFDDVEAGHAESRGIAPDARRAIFALLDGDGPHGRIGEHPFAPDRPEPAPMSQSNSPRRGASDDSVSARTSRLVIWPSCSNRSSASPAARAGHRLAVARGAHRRRRRPPATHRKTRLLRQSFAPSPRRSPRTDRSRRRPQPHAQGHGGAGRQGEGFQHRRLRAASGGVDRGAIALHDEVVDAVFAEARMRLAPQLM